MDSFERLKKAIQRYMKGIYGFDKLGGVLLIVYAILLALGSGIILRILRIAVLAYFFYRFLSQNHDARAAENDKLEGLIAKITGGSKRVTVTEDKSSTKAYVTCPNCHKQFALPKGKGTLRATCPHCGAKSIHTV